MIVATMSALLLSILGLSAGIPHCPMWKEIAPCTCRLDPVKLTTISCDRMSSYDQMVKILNGHFGPNEKIYLKLSFSKLDDLPFRNFKELNMSIEHLKLNHDNLGELDEETFDGLNKVVFFSLADNPLGKVPSQLWKKMPRVLTLDLGRTRLKELTDASFKELSLQCLILAGNFISRMSQDTFPRHVQRLHIGRNNLKSLNKTLTNLSNLNWLFANANELTDIEGELPSNAKNLKMIHFANNKIGRLPQQLKYFADLETLFFQNNQIKCLNGTLSKSRKLKRVVLEHNQIGMLSKDDFPENELLESLILSHNLITSLNGSLLNLKKLNFFNMTHNLLEEFSFQEIVGLHELQSIDLSFNRIKTLIGPATNLVEWNIKLTELKLDHNELTSLGGALSGLPELLRLNLSFNKLTQILPDDLIGLDQLRLLDISYNYLTTLEETSKTFLPRLEELRASDNYLTILERDFHGLPVLCHADLSNNQIIALGRDLVSKTRCKIGHEIHEGTWDTLKIYLQNNPILCDAALPEIMSSMEINHTRIYGVAHCPPLNEQPVTSKPNAFLGYIPESTPQIPAAVSGSYDGGPNNKLGPMFKTYEAIQLSIPQDQISSKPQQNAVVDLKQNDQYRVEQVQSQIDPIKQEKQLSKLASELEELRSRVDELASQNQILLNQQLNKSTEKPPNEELRKDRKP